MPDLFETTGVHQAPLIDPCNGGIVDPTIDMADGNRVYGFQPKHYPRPELLAPVDEAAGGFLFLPGKVSDEFLSSLVELANVGDNEHYRRDRYGVQCLDAPEGMEASLGYLRKLVIADRMALRYMYRSIENTDDDSIPLQPLSILELVKAFVEDERRKYGTSFMNRSLDGKFGGDGYMAIEELSFGFSIENLYNGVISIWSRAWLVTK